MRCFSTCAQVAILCLDSEHPATGVLVTSTVGGSSQPQGREKEKRDEDVIQTKEAPEPTSTPSPFADAVASKSADAAEHSGAETVREAAEIVSVFFRGRLRAMPADDPWRARIATTTESLERLAGAERPRSGLHVVRP